MADAEGAEPMRKFTDNGGSCISRGGLFDVVLLCQGQGIFAVDPIAGPCGQKLRITIVKGVSVPQKTMSDIITCTW